MKTALVAGLAGALLSAGAANAFIIPVDDFSVDSGPVSDPTVNGVGRDADDVVIDADTGLQRRLFINATRQLRPLRNQIVVSDGLLDITNGVGDDSETRVIYTGFEYVNDIIPSNATALAFLLQVVESDANDITVELRENGNSLGFFFIPGDTINETLRFDIPLDTVFSTDLRIIINGEPGYDVALDSFGLDVTVPPVPAPAMVGLFGLGLVALGARRRRA